MHIVTTDNRDDHRYYNKMNYIYLEDYILNKKIEYNVNGLKFKYDCGNLNNIDHLEHIRSGAGDLGTREFSNDNQRILKEHLFNIIEQKDKINIVEIGVNRNKFEYSSTSVFLNNKRDNDIYIGIDIEDKTDLNNESKNIYTIKSESQNIDYIFDILKLYNINEIDILMIDGWHSVNQCYFEWENYTKILSKNGIVVMHDTNSHPGPYFLVNSIDDKQYEVYKYLSDVQDWGISVAIKKN